MPIPEEVLHLVRVVMERPDFAHIEWDPDLREWTAALHTGARRENGAPAKKYLYGERLTQALEKARVEPAAPPLQRALLLAGGAR